MARYQVGNRLRFFNPREMIGPRDGEVIEIQHDGEMLGGESIYLLRCELRGGMQRRYTANDRHVITIINQQPTQDPTPPTGPIVNVVNPADIEEEEVEDNDDAEQTEAPVQAPIPGINWGTIGVDLRNMWGRTRADELKDEARENIATYRAFGFDPIDFIVIEDRAVPVFRSQDFAGRIETGDYDGNAQKARYFTYQIGEITLHPTYTHNGRIDYYSTINGQFWVNQYRDADVRLLNPDLRTTDNLGVAWTRQANLRGQAITATALKKKRKLRRKYKTMPQIRDEKHYAGQEFIA